MKNIEISIQLDPVNDGVNSFPTDVRMKGRGALVIGTNGNYRFIAEDEAIEVMDKLSGCCETEYICKTSYLVVYNSNKVIKTIEGKFFVGSALIVKGTNAGMEFLSEDEIDTVVNEFASRMATLCSGDIQFSAYEI